MTKKIMMKNKFYFIKNIGKTALPNKSKISINYLKKLVKLFLNTNF